MMAFEPTVTRLRDTISDRYHHFEVQIGGQKGFGTDHKEPMALLKAFSEAVERCVFKSMKLAEKATSSGFAGHTDIAHAIEYSLSELIERDAFMLAWVSQTGPRWISLDGVNESMKNEILEIESQGFRIKLGELAKSGAYTIAVGVLLPNASRRFGGIFSSSASKDLNHAFASVLTELRRAANLVKNLGDNPYQDTPPTPTNGAQTMQYYLNPMHFKKVDLFMRGSRHTLVLPEFEAKSAEAPHGMPNLPWDIRVARSWADSCQNLVFGQLSKSDINIARFQTANLPIRCLEAVPLP